MGKIIAYVTASDVYDDSRVTKELQALLEAGYKIVVYGWDRSGTAEKMCNKLYSKHGGQIKCCFFKKSDGGKVIKKLYVRYMWCRWLKTQLLKNEQIEIIHACDFDAGFIVRKVSEKKNIPYVYDIFDYYIDAHSILALVARVIEKQEINVINHAYATIICTEERREQIKKANPREIVVVHNTPEVEKCNSSNLEYDYAYCGGLYSDRLILEIARLHKKYNSMKFIFAGGGDYETEVRKCGENENFVYVGRIPYDEVLNVEAKTKVLSAIYAPVNRNHRLCAPNKFYEALALGKPVIVCKGTGIDTIVKENEIGVVINYSAEEFYAALEYLLKNEALRIEMGNRARELYEHEYTWTEMKKRFLNIFMSISNNTRLTIRESQ